MASGIISWAGDLVNVTRHHHRIGLCPEYVDGVEVVRWIEIVSGQCVYGTLGSVSWSFGMPEFKILLIFKDTCPSYHGYAHSYLKSSPTTKTVPLKASRLFSCQIGLW
jgi:hypothetical protein